MGEIARYFHSSVIPTSQHVSWTVHDVHDVEKLGAWTACSCTLEIPLHGKAAVSRWQVSLYEQNRNLYLRPKLIAPNNEILTYQLSVRTGGEMTAFKMEETPFKPREQQKFSIGSIDSVLAKSGNSNLELGIAITVFSQDHWETVE